MTRRPDDPIEPEVCARCDERIEGEPIECLGCNLLVCFECAECEPCAEAAAEAHAEDRYQHAMEAESERIAERWDREF